MSLTHAFNLDLDNGLRKPGDLVAGIVDVDEARASELNIDEIRVELLADVKTWVATLRFCGVVEIFWCSDQLS